VSKSEVTLARPLKSSTSQSISQTNATITSTIGGAKEMVGSMLGQAELEKSGAQQK
jgi:uncharacterized protein YjbJ (UPF0337 family)